MSPAVRHDQDRSSTGATRTEISVSLVRCCAVSSSPFCFCCSTSKSTLARPRAVPLRAVHKSEETQLNRKKRIAVVAVIAAGCMAAGSSRRCQRPRLERHDPCLRGTDVRRTSPGEVHRRRPGSTLCPRVPGTCLERAGSARTNWPGWPGRLGWSGPPGGRRCQGRRYATADLPELHCFCDY